MGCPVTIPSSTERDEDPSDEDRTKLDDFLSGRLGDIDIDSVEAVRDVRECR